MRFFPDFRNPEEACYYEILASMMQLRVRIMLFLENLHAAVLGLAANLLMVVMTFLVRSL